MTHLKNGYLPENGTLGGRDEKATFGHGQGAACLQVKSSEPILYPGKSLVAFTPIVPAAWGVGLLPFLLSGASICLTLGAALLPKQIW